MGEDRSSNWASKSAAESSNTSVVSIAVCESASNGISNSSSCFCRASISDSSAFTAASGMTTETPDSADKLSKSMPSMFSMSCASVLDWTEFERPATVLALLLPEKKSKSMPASSNSSALVIEAAVTSDSSPMVVGSKSTAKDCSPKSIAKSSSRATSVLTSGGCSSVGVVFGKTRLMYRPLIRMASALLRKASEVQALSRLPAISSIQREKPVRLSPDNCSMCSLAGFCSANQPLNNCSIDHAASPNSLRPTIRELPLSV